MAGPVVGGHVATPNLEWDVDASVIARELDEPTVGLMIDLEANAHGIFTLDDSDFAVLSAGAGRGDREYGGDLRGDRARGGRRVLGRGAAPPVPW